MRRSIAEQTDAELGGPLSVLVRQKRDHIRLDRLLAELSHSGGHAERRTLNEIMRLVFTHAFAEEAVLWPALRRTLPDGEALTQRVEREHQEINELARQLDATVAGPPGRSELLDRLVTMLREDVRDEEDVLLPRLQQALTTAQLRRLGVQWELVRRTAPTRPHPNVARRPPGNLAAAVPLTMLDRGRDVLEHAAGRQRAHIRSVLRTLARMLTAVSDRVERTRPVRAGERASTHTHPDGRHDG